MMGLHRNSLVPFIMMYLHVNNTLMPLTITRLTKKNDPYTGMPSTYYICESLQTFWFMWRTFTLLDCSLNCLIPLSRISHTENACDTTDGWLQRLKHSAKELLLTYIFMADEVEYAIPTRHHNQNLLNESGGPVQLKLLCGADLLESFDTPGLWKETDVCIISYIISIFTHEYTWYCKKQL